MGKKKAVKVWDAHRSKKYGLRVSSLEELKRTGKRKLEYANSVEVDVVLEEDGTEVDEEDYFQCVPDNLIYILLKPGEVWQPPGSTDVPDGPCKPAHSNQCDGDSDDDSDDDVLATSAAVTRGASHVGRSLAELTRSLRKDIINIQTFSNEERQSVIDLDSAELASLIGRSESDALNLQMSWQQTLDLALLAGEARDMVQLMREKFGENRSERDNSHFREEDTEPHPRKRKKSS